MRTLILITFFVYVIGQDSLGETDEVETITVESSTHHHHRKIHHHQRTNRRKQPVCVNGKAVNGTCECELDYIGDHCEKKKHCETFRRFRNGSCPDCSTGYTGDFCEKIICKNGERKNHDTECFCHEPYSGLHCDELETKKIYSYYNRKVFLLGPLGAIALLPMCALYMGCEYFAKKRQVKRVGLMMEGQNINVRNQTLERLLKNL